VSRPVVSVVDYHTGGEPFRIVTGGVPPLEGATILERRRFARAELDAFRRLLVYEPRGHADMYGCHVVPPDDEGADLGVVFFHNEGYSPACGHGTIELVTWALDEGVVDKATLWWEIGQAQERAGDLDEAQAAYEEMLAQGDRDAHHALGELALLRGDRTEARRHFAEGAAAGDPDAVEALRSLQ